MKNTGVKCDTGWARQELGKVNFGDERLNKRAIKVAEASGQRPSVPINYACEDWAETKAAYRLFSNKRVDEAKLFAVHREKTCERIKNEAVVLAIQDTTTMNYNGHDSCQGLGSVGAEKLKGIFLHHTLAVTPQGLPLGLLTQKKDTRLKVKRLSNKERGALPIEAKESMRWIDALRETVVCTKEAKQVITVCDREGDFYEFLMEAKLLNTDYLVRSCHPRAILDSQAANLIEALEAQPALGTFEVNLPSREGGKKRTALLEVRCTRVTLKPPKRPASLKAKLTPLTIDVVLAKEINSVSTEQALRWVLLTNVAVKNFQDALERIEWYKTRWFIETYHKILKSGCQVEECRLETVRGLYLYLTLFGIIAWRIFWCTHIGRAHPNEPAATVVTRTEHETLCLLAGRKEKKRIDIKTARHAIREIAKLGGFLARRYDGFPGPTVIWRGFQRLADAVDMYEISRSQSCG